MATRIPSHLYRNRHGTFYFRLRIPDDLREHIQQREFRFSLGTEQRNQALAAALVLVPGIPELMAKLRAMAKEEKEGEAASALGLGGYFFAWVEERRKTLNLQAKVDELRLALIDAHEQLQQSVGKDVAERVVKTAYDKGQLKGRRELEERLIFPWLPEKTALFSALREAWLKSLVANRIKNGRKPTLTDKTRETYANSTEFFITAMGDMRIGEIDREIVGAYSQLLQSLPPNISRKREYRGKSLEQIAALGHVPQSAVNVSKKLEHASSMFKWALEEKRKWGIDANPFAGAGLMESEEPKRRPFTMDEVRTLLQHKSYVTRRFSNSYCYWLIPLALYTGARLTELAQLDLKDFVVVDEIPCIDINDIDAVEVTKDVNGRNKRVKNKNAKRLVPIHSVLIELGLLRYVGQLKLDGGVHLFPELSRTRRDGPGHAASNWFQRIRKSVGLTSKQETVFHSFRHLFITNILDSGISPHMLAPIVGHEADLITGKVYWNKKDATKRLPTVEIFNLPGDLVALLPRIEEVEFKPVGRSKK